MNRVLVSSIVAALLVLLAAAVRAQAAAYRNEYGRLPAIPKPGDRWFADYFRAETTRLAASAADLPKTREDWMAARPRFREELLEMLGLSPMPERTDLHPVVTGRLEHPEFRVENLHFQSRPGLYATANLYLPKQTQGPSPAILYVCGHAQVKSNGVSYGNKTAYQHHGAWFARNGYVCLVMDTIQLGEIEGIHHGTYREGMWWWNSRGYTPAGAEAWNCIRALDYLQSRPEVDGTRLGVTGRSGGGAYSWWLAALDDRIAAACPIAGITDLENHVHDGVVEGHCDCMYWINTYRWDFGRLAAMVAPRPLLIGNTDKDTIFPLDGVVRVHEQARKVYDVLGAWDRLGLLITEGGHKDTQELQVPVLRWFNRWLKKTDVSVETAAKPLFAPEQLRVFQKLPEDQATSRAHESFTRLASTNDSTDDEVLIAAIRKKCFGGWPATVAPTGVRSKGKATGIGMAFETVDFEVNPGGPLRLYLMRPERGIVRQVRFQVLSEREWRTLFADLQGRFGSLLTEESQVPGVSIGSVPSDVQDRTLARLGVELERDQEVVAWVTPRGVGLTAITEEGRYFVQLRRRFQLLGQTLAGMQAWDILMASTSLRTLPGLDAVPQHWVAGASMRETTAFAALFADRVESVTLDGPLREDKDCADFLNWRRLVTPERLQQLLKKRVKVVRQDPGLGGKLD